ncbi:MAG TPA: peptidoglycan editing factor PgeF [Nocardioidaceae bacterium]|nr:peptidoglycan editing factor PgeF [Nocardioidaceae bacterium]
MFAFRDTRGRVDVAFTDRHGGVSDGPFTSLNLAVTGDDDPLAVAENVRRMVEAFTGDRSAPVVGMHQVHGSDVVVVSDAEVGEAASGRLPVGDALVTVQPGVALMVRAADCVPVLLADQAAGVVAAVHSGRPGVAAGVVTRAVETMRDLGADHIDAWVGPHVCGACYEVPEAMREEVAAQVPETYATTTWGTPALDIGAGVRAQLAAAGVAVTVVDRCTREDEDLFSYRRQGRASGRLAGLAWVRP